MTWHSVQVLSRRDFTLRFHNRVSNFNTHHWEYFLLKTNSLRLFDELSASNLELFSEPRLPDTAELVK